MVKSPALWRGFFYIYSMRRYFVIALISFVATGKIEAQSFDVSDTIKYVSSTINSSTPPHDYIQLINNTADTLHLRWIEYKLPGFPISWDLALQDPNVYHFPTTPDSADFYILSPATSTDKMVTNLYHNSISGSGRVKYKIFPIHDPADSLNIYFDFKIDGSPNGIPTQNKPEIHCQFIGEFLQIEISGNIIQPNCQIFNAVGQIVYSSIITSERFQIPLNGSDNFYLIRISHLNGLFIKKFIRM